MIYMELHFSDDIDELFHRQRGCVHRQTLQLDRHRNGYEFTCTIIM